MKIVGTHLLKVEKLAKNKGFTIVELLIVVVVIAILATITVVSYNGITRMARESAIKSELVSTAKSIKSESLLGAMNESLVSKYLTKTSSGTTVTYQYGNQDDYCLNAVDGNGTTFYVHTKDGISNTKNGACPTSVSTLTETRCVAGRVYISTRIENSSPDTISVTGVIYNNTGAVISGSDTATVNTASNYYNLFSIGSVSSTPAGFSKAIITYPNGTTVTQYYAYPARTC